MYAPPWTRLDRRDRTGGPFGASDDTDNRLFQSHFQWADLVAIGIAKGIRVRFANNSYEGAVAKAGFRHELVPVLQRWTRKFTVGGDDPDCDGVSNDGRNLSHEYDVVDVDRFLRQQ